MKIAYICSPYSGDIKKNTERAQCACRYAYEEGYVPFAPHLLYPQFLSEKSERDEAMHMCLEMMARCHELWVFYGDFGRVSEGMMKEIEWAKRMQLNIRYFNLSDLTQRKMFGSAEGDYIAPLKLEGKNNLCEGCRHHIHYCDAACIDQLNIADGCVVGCSAMEG